MINDAGITLKSIQVRIGLYKADEKDNRAALLYNTEVDEETDAPLLHMGQQIIPAFNRKMEQVSEMVLQ